MGNNHCCDENNLDIIEYDTQIEEKDPEKIAKTYIKVIEKIKNKLILIKENNINNINKSYLTNLSNIPELIEIINKNIELIKINNKENQNNIEIKQNLKENIDSIIKEIDQKYELLLKEIKLLSELEIKENDEALYYLKFIEPFKNKAINYIDNINSKDLENYINIKRPSKTEYSFLRLIFLIINPEEKAKIPGLIITKDLEIIQKDFFKKGPDKIKQKFKDILDNLSLITFDILEENKLFTEYPYNDLNQMEKISDFHKNFFGFFQNFINCKKSHDIYYPYFLKLEETKKKKESLIKKKERLEKIKQEIIILI